MTEATRLSVSGMSCAGCVASVEDALNSVDGVSLASVNFAEHTAMVEGEVSVETLVAAIRAAGYDAAQLTGAEDESEKEAAEMEYYRKLLKKAAFAGVIGAPLFIFGMSGMLPGFDAGGRLFWLGIGLLTIIVLVYSGGHFFTGAWKSAKNHNANMDTLIALGTGTAWLYSICLLYTSPSPRD